MGQVAVLAGGQVDVAALGVGVGIELGGLGGVVVHLHVVHRQAGEGFNAAFELVG